MIRARTAHLLLVTLLVSACDWKRTRQADPPTAEPGAKIEADRAEPDPARQASQQNVRAPPTDAALAMPTEVRSTEEILVNGERRCAIGLRYGDNRHEVTWPGPCSSMKLARLYSIDDLKRFGILDNLEEEDLRKVQDYLPLMPNRRALYVEGNSTSALYLEFNDRIDEVYLAD